MEERTIKDINNLLTQLFQKMHEAGYEWNTEMKELKKIHVIDEGKAEMDYCFTKMMNGEKVSSAWSEEDDTKIKSIITFLKSPSLCAMDGNKGIIDENIKYLKSLKGKVQPKQEWSEEDIRNIENIDSVLFYDKDLPEDTCMRLRNWLKSLRPQNRWKPSDEHLEALKNAIHLKPFENPSDSILWGLYEQLKKL